MKYTKYVNEDIVVFEKTIKSIIIDDSDNISLGYMYSIFRENELLKCISNNYLELFGEEIGL